MESQRVRQDLVTRQQQTLNKCTTSVGKWYQWKWGCWPFCSQPNGFAMAYSSMLPAWCRGFMLMWLFVTLWTIALQAPPSMGFPREEYWSGLPVLHPGDFPRTGIKPMSPTLAGGFFTTVPPGKPHDANCFPKWLCQVILSLARHECWLLYIFTTLFLVFPFL